MATREEERLAKINAGRIKAANAVADKRLRDEAARARALSSGNRTAGKVRGSGGGNSNTSQGGGKPFRLRLHARTNTKAGAHHAFTRTPRAPRAISHFRFERKYSNRAGAHGSPTSARGKILYDTDNFTNDPDSRVKAVLVYAPAGTPRDAIDPARMAAQCEATAGRQVNSRQMAHDTASLPKELTDAQRERLAMKIAQRISESMSGVPVYAAIHEPDGKNHNHHVHLSAPLREVIDRGNGEFALGERVAFEQRPAWREAHGLEKTNHSDLRMLRAGIASDCADALEEAGIERHVCERWRYGHLRLNGNGDTQTGRARERGDVDFVEQNQFREVQQHEGPGRRRDNFPTPSQEHNAALQDGMAPRILAGRILQDSLNEAIEKKTESWEDLRSIAASKGLAIHYVKRQHKDGTEGQVTGWQAELMGNRVSGQQAGITLRNAKTQLSQAGLEWAKKPPEFTPAPELKTDPRQTARAIIAEASHQQAAPGGAQPALAGEDRRRPIQPAAPKALVPHGTEPKQQPEPPRREAFTSAKKEPSMDASAVMKELSKPLPTGNRSITEQPPAPLVPKPASRHGAADPAPAAQTAPVQPSRMPLSDLTDFEKSAMIVAYRDQREIQRQQRRIAEALEKRKTLLRSEPKPTTGLIFKKPSQAHEDWRRRVGEMNRCVQMTQRHVEKWLDEHVYNDPDLAACIQQQRDERESSRRQAVLGEYEKTESILRGQNVYNRPKYQRSQARRLDENPWLRELIEERNKAEAQARAEAKAQKQTQTVEPGADTAAPSDNGTWHKRIRPTG